MPFNLPMRQLLALLIYLSAVFVGGALLSPWIYQWMQWAAAIFPGLHTLANNPFHRYVSRSFLIFGMLGLWPFLRSTSVRSWNDLGLATRNRLGERAGSGFLLGFGSLAGVAGLAILTGTRQLNFAPAPVDILRHLCNATLAAVCVAIMEELFFRGVVFGALRRAYSLKTALVLSSALYALLHFFERPETPKWITWSSGLTVLGGMMRGFAELEAFLPGFFNLTLAGIILALAYDRTGTLFFSMGLHAGWIFWLKSYSFLTQGNPGTNAWFWGSGKLIDGWLALVILSLVCGIVCRLRLNNKTICMSQPGSA